MKKTLSLLTLLFCLFLACNEEIEVDPDTGFEIYTIGSGQHSSIVRTEPFAGNGISVIVKFDDSAIYTLQDPGNQADINKLIGFSDCGQHHQSESARFGWRWYEDELQILAYVYSDGNLTWELMGAIALNEEVTLELSKNEDQYVFTGTGLQTTTVSRTASCESGENYWLWPYFGGDEPAPHTVRVELKRSEVQ